MLIKFDGYWVFEILNKDWFNYPVSNIKNPI
jgi:hypothetical protein